MEETYLVGNLKKHKYSTHKQIWWESNLCKSAFAAKETLKSTNSNDVNKSRFPSQYVEIFNKQENSTKTSWWIMREITRDVTRHIEANKRCYECDICEKIALVWKISTTKRSKPKKSQICLWKCDYNHLSRHP